MAKSNNRAARHSHNKQNNAITFKRILKYCGVGILMFVSVLAFRKLISREKVYQMSDVIQTLMSVGEGVVDLHGKASHLLTSSPSTIELIKQNLRPVQERLSSLRIQTSQYEKMERISGGPKSFIESSLKELDAIQIELVQIVTVTLPMLVSKSSLSSEIQKQSENLVNDHAKLTDSGLLQFIILENFVFLPMGEDEKMTVEKALESGTVTFETGLEKLIKLKTMYQKLTSDGEELSRILQLSLVYINRLSPSEIIDHLMKLSPEDYALVDPLVDNIIQLRIKIDEEKKIEKVTYQAYYAIVIRILRELMELTERLHNSLGEDKKMILLNMESMIMEDLRKLRIRINNLRFTYVKQEM